MTKMSVMNCVSSPVHPQVTFGVFGYSEKVVTEPISPREILAIIYDHCMPYQPIEAVLQQEVKHKLTSMVKCPLYYPELTDAALPWGADYTTLTSDCLPGHAQIKNWVSLVTCLSCECYYMRACIIRWIIQAMKNELCEHDYSKVHVCLPVVNILESAKTIASFLFRRCTNFLRMR